MIIKFSTTDDFNSDVIPAAIVTDYKQLIKRAGSERFKHVKVAKHQTPVHLIALGSYEGTGPNRNTDAFSEPDCREYHHTFVKAGRAVHYNHKNKPTDPKHGDIHASDYNDPMKRIELLIGLDNNDPKNAKSLQKLSEGKQVSYSMASSQAYDVCSECGHKSYDGKTDRCEHIPKRLGEITKTGNMIHMKNPRPKWFEISDVPRGADRIAWSINKTASAHDGDRIERYENNLKQAQEIFLPASLTLSKYASSKRTLLNKISEIEKHISAIAAGKVEGSKDKYIKTQASKLNQCPQLSDKTIKELRAFEDHHKLLKVMADNGIIFSPEEFYKYLFNGKDMGHLEDMKSHLSSIHNDIKDNDEEIHNEDFQPEEGSIPSAIVNLVKALSSDHSLFNNHAKNRVMRITIIGNKPAELKKESSVKSVSLLGKQLAIKYANYQLSALTYLEENDRLDNEMITNTLIMNRR